MSDTTINIAGDGTNLTVPAAGAKIGAPAVMNKVINLLSRWAGFVGGSAIIVMMFLTFVDVVLRYFFNRPIAGGLEITEYLMAISVALTLAYCAFKKGHIRVTAGTALLPKRTQLIFDSVIMLIGVVFFSLMSWQSAVQAGVMYNSGSYSSVLRIPVYPFVWVVFIGSIIITLIFLRDLVESVARAVKESSMSWLWFFTGSAVVLLLGVAMYFGQYLPWSMGASSFGLVGIVLLIVLLFSGLHVGLVLGLVGFLGMAFLSSGAGLGLLGTVPYSTIASYNMSVVPLFIIMGEFALYSGISTDLYWAAYKWLGRLPGGLAIATVGACAGFAAISGSSLATAATLGAVSLPEMKRHGYSDALATGVIAAGGTIGILIPPSVILVIYGIMTQQSIGKLFLGGFIPGILEAIIYTVIIYFLCRRNPLLGPQGARTTLHEKVVSLKGIWPVLVLFLLVMGGIYTGIFSPNEAAGIGAMGTFLFALGKKKLTRKNLTASFMDTGETSAMTFFILFAAMIFGYFLSVTRLPFALTSFVSDLNLNRYIILGAIYLVYLFLGCIMSSTAMILITVPIFFPLIVALGFDPIWFGIMIVTMCEIGVITPPVGMNVYIIYGVARDVPMQSIFRGIVPFLIGDIIRVAILTALPQIVMFLPNMME
ncbi:MAG: TRAP transporter large permease subunit [Dehalococcoidia bacterium]|nr:TRAP transporter large permease subunit [Dehalococcoidia bacterium]